MNQLNPPSVDLTSIESVLETTDHEKVNSALTAGYVLLSVGTDPHGEHHYSLGVLRQGTKHD